MELKSWAFFFACLALAFALPEPADKNERSLKAEDGKIAAATDKKQEKRGLLDLGYGYSEGFSHDLDLTGHNDIGLGLESDLGRIEHHGHVKHVTITKKVPVPVPHLVPYTVIKKVGIPYPVKVSVPVDRPYPVHVPQPYPVHVDKPVPYPVEKPVPYPVKVPVKVPYPVPHPVAVPKPVPYTVHKPVPYPVKVPVYVEKHVPVLVKDYHHHEGFGGLEENRQFEHSDFGLDEFQHHH